MIYKNQQISILSAFNEICVFRGLEYNKDSGPFFNASYHIL